jgi:hypothetical protein
MSLKVISTLTPVSMRVLIVKARLGQTIYDGGLQIDHPSLIPHEHLMGHVSSYPFLVESEGISRPLRYIMGITDSFAPGIALDHRVVA